MATPSTTPNAWAFLREIVARLGAKNPKFFNVFSWIGGVATFVTGLPYLLSTIPNLVLPPDILVLENKAVTIASAVVFIMANLAVQRDVVATTASGTIVVPGSSKELPFTKKVEAAKVEAVKAEATKSTVN